MKRIRVSSTWVVCFVFLLFSTSAVAQFGGALKKLGKAAADAEANSKKPASKSGSSTSSSDKSSTKASSSGKSSDDTKKSDDSNSTSGDAAASSDTAPDSKADAGAKSDAGGQPEMKSVPIDFVPGEKTVFFDDFSDMAPDEPPPHWKVREGTVDLLMNGKERELHSEKGVEITSPSVTVPTNFTFQLVWTGKGEMVWRFRDKQNENMLEAVVRGEPDGHTASVRMSGPGSALGDGEVKVDTTVPVEFDLWAQQGRVRAYIAGKRLVDVNQVDFKPIDHMVAHLAGYRPNGIRSVRIAESAPDPGSVLASTGKYVTHGINFDNDSDRLKPESAPVIKQIAGALIKNPALKLEVDGYTDSVGNAAHNLDLSKRRAAAVQQVLVSQFGIDAERLTSNGYGPDKPIASNDTADGRAQNRRVEFVKK